MSYAAPGPGTGSPMRLLIDSNVFIALEPYAGQLEPGQAPAAELMRLVAEQGHKIFTHPATTDDLVQGKDELKRRQRLAELDKFPKLVEGKIPKFVTDTLGSPADGSNDHRDLRLLGALYNNAVGHLISNDVRLRKRAVRLGLGERVLSLDDAVEMLRQLAPTVSTPPPRVQAIEPYALDAEQAIFLSLSHDYPGFHKWLNDKVRTEPDNRDCHVVEEDGCYAALAIAKRLERDCAYPFLQPVTKAATLKVGDDYVGNKYGELLLKALFTAAHDRRTASMYVEVFPRHEGLIELLAHFGFTDSGHRTGRGEHVLLKSLSPRDDAPSLSPLAHHVAHGPPAIQGTGKVFIIPIWPNWHRQLFPDSPPDATPDGEQLALMPTLTSGTHPWGNALRKAYLSNSANRQLTPGDTLLFYRSRGPRTVTAVGVVEDTLRSADPVAVMSFVGRRTVYTPQEIARMCSRVGGVLAVLFRQDRFLDPPWSLAELQGNRVVRAWPQSITQVRGGGAQWVHDRLAE